ncbi:MAG: hypothetical protein KGQ67_05090 [Betaproteobacteria bacterium]|nr:hypothetical protein [Betaproteobacteria bacterium]
MSRCPDPLRFVFACGIALLLPILAVLVGCGGGSSSGGSPGGGIPGAETPASGAPSASIVRFTTVNTNTTVTLDGSGSAPTAGLSYQWTLTARPTGSSATLTNPGSATPIITPDLGGTYTVVLTVTNSAGQSAIDTLSFTAVQVIDPAIVLGSAEPLSGSVQLSLSGTVAGSVTWYIDLMLMGTGSGAAGAPITWNTASYANGSHSIIARIQVGANSYQEVRRTVTVGNSSVTLLTATPSGTTGTIAIDARAASSYGIASVSGSLDGGPATVLTAPNACSRFCSSSNDVYRFTVNAGAVGSGSHTLVIVATDNNGSRRTLTVPVPVSNAPVITLAGPADGAFVNGLLRINGSAVTDKGGTVTTVARLGDVQVLGTTLGSFDALYDITGISARDYTLTVTATDKDGLASVVTRRVVITSSPALGYTPVFTLPPGASLLAAEGTQVLVATSDGGAYLRDLVSGAEVVLRNAAGIQYATDWQISGGRVYAQAKDSDCTLTFNCIYSWDASGTRSNLSTASPFTAGSAYQENPVARGGFVAWTNWNGPNAGSYTLYEAATGKFTRISPPAGINYVGNTDYDLAVVGGVVHFVSWGQTGGSGTSSSFDIIRWQSDTGVSTRVTSDGLRNIYPQTDGARIAWQRSPVGGSVDGTVSLITQPLTGGAATAVASGASTSFSLRGGVLAWRESASNSPAVKADTAAATTVLSPLSSGALYASGEGKVIYGESGWVYSWNSATGVRTLRLETTPGVVFVTGGAMVFTVNSAVYRVGL